MVKIHFCVDLYGIKTDFIHPIDIEIVISIQRNIPRNKKDPIYSSFWYHVNILNQLW